MQALYSLGPSASVVKYLTILYKIDINAPWKAVDRETFGLSKVQCLIRPKRCVFTQILHTQ